MTAPEGASSAGFDFVGAKAALICGQRILTYLRDDRPGLPWPGFWDLPGGGRERRESPEDCLLRELHEEFGLRLGPAHLLHRWVLPSMTGAALPGVFFAGRLGPSEVAAIRFGCEGQRWDMMEIAAFLAHPRAVPALLPRVRLALSALGC